MGPSKVKKRRNHVSRQNYRVYTNSLLQSRVCVIFWDFIHEEILSCVSPASRGSQRVREQRLEYLGRCETQGAMPRARMIVTRNKIFANVGKPGWSTGCQAVLGSPDSCCLGRVARRNRYSPCALDEVWKPGPSPAPSWPDSPPRIGPSRSPAATSGPLAYFLLPEPSSLRVGPGTPVLVPAGQEWNQRNQRKALYNPVNTK